MVLGGMLAVGVREGLGGLGGYGYIFLLGWHSNVYSICIYLTTNLLPSRSFNHTHQFSL